MTRGHLIAKGEEGVRYRVDWITNVEQLKRSFRFCTRSPSSSHALCTLRDFVSPLLRLQNCFSSRKIAVICRCCTNDISIVGTHKLSKLRLIRVEHLSMRFDPIIPACAKLFLWIVSLVLTFQQAKAVPMVMDSGTCFEADFVRVTPYLPGTYQRFTIDVAIASEESVFKGPKAPSRSENVCILFPSCQRWSHECCYQTTSL